MIVIGVCPSMSAVAYSVLCYSGTGVGPEPVDNDVLRAGRRNKTPTTTYDAMKRWHAHSLILDVVLERAPPALVAIGPSLSVDEAPEAVLVPRLALTAVAALLGVPCIDFPVIDDVYEALRIEQNRQLTAHVRKHLRGVLSSRDQRVVLATAAAMAAAVELEQ